MPLIPVTMPDQLTEPALLGKASIAGLQLRRTLCQRVIETLPAIGAGVFVRLLPLLTAAGAEAEFLAPFRLRAAAIDRKFLMELPGGERPHRLRYTNT